MKTPTTAMLASKLARAIHNELASTMFKAKDALRIFSSLRITPVITFTPRTPPTASASRRTTPRKTSMRRSSGSWSCRRSWRRSRGRRSRLLRRVSEITGIDPALPGHESRLPGAAGRGAHHAGSKRHMVKRLFSGENERFYRSAKVLEIGAIEPRPLKPFIAERFDSTDRAVGRRRRRRAARDHDGLPYATQELAYALWEEVPFGLHGERRGSSRRPRLRREVRERALHAGLGAGVARAAPRAAGARRRAGHLQSGAYRTRSASRPRRRCNVRPKRSWRTSSSRSRTMGPTRSESPS